MSRACCRDLPVLMYHALEDEDHPAGAKNPGEQLYVVPVQAFREQMAYLAANGFTVLLLEELFQLDIWPEKGVVLTFDDGHQSNYSLALPVLQQFGFAAHFFITTGWLNTPYFLTGDEVKILAESGMETGSHGVTHNFFSDMELSAVEAELVQSREILERYSGKAVTSFSAPGGRVCPEIIVLGKKAGYSIFCTSEFSLLSPQAGHENIPRIAVKADTDMTTFAAMLHGDSRYMRTQRARNVFLSSLKKILGNAVYEKFRAAVLQGR